MTDCIIYARVSTKEQQAEGYSIPAQLKAIRAFCEAEGLSPVAEFIEAESAGHAGRTQFGKMLEYLSANPEVRTVVAHKLDRLYRNFSDQIALEEELGIRARYVVGDVPETPQGELIRDVQLSVSKFYLGNLAEEVRKGMDEKVSQGGWPHKAPTGYSNDKNTRSVVIDRKAARNVAYAFERYATGDVSLKALSQELFERGRCARAGKPISPSALQKMLQNPFYAGRLRYKGEVHKGTHQSLVSEELFEEVQTRFAPRRNGPARRTKHTYALRDWMTCAECGCKITAETQRGHVYYRCTHGKDCSQRTYAREEALFAEVERILGRIDITPDIVDALIKDCLRLDEEDSATHGQEASRIEREIASLDAKASRLLDSYLEGVVEAEAYRQKSSEIARAKTAFERELSTLAHPQTDKTAQVAALAGQAVGAKGRFITADTAGKRRIMSQLLSNIKLSDAHVASYQYKRPFQVLQQDPKGTFCESWWAILDLNQ